MLPLALPIALRAGLAGMSLAGLAVAERLVHDGPGAGLVPHPSSLVALAVVHAAVGAAVPLLWQWCVGTAGSLQADGGPAVLPLGWRPCTDRGQQPTTGPVPSARRGRGPPERGTPHHLAAPRRTGSPTLTTC